MPLGLEEYEPERIEEEEEEPERDGKRVDVIKIGLWMLGIVALVVIASWARAMMSMSVANPSPLQQNLQRKGIHTE